MKISKYVFLDSILKFNYYLKYSFEIFTINYINNILFQITLFHTYYALLITK